MNSFLPLGVSPTNFQYIYKHYIKPQIIAIDIFIKSSEQPYSLEGISEILGIDYHDLLHIIDEYDITTLDKTGFFKIMTKSSSYVGNLISRQFSMSNKSVYTPENIAYIYNLDINSVEEAFYVLGTTYIDEKELGTLFKNIKLSKYNFKALY